MQSILQIVSDKCSKMLGTLNCRCYSVAAVAQLPQRLSAQLTLGFLLSRRWALSLCSCSCRKGISFLLPEQKKRNKENSPSALFCLLRHFSPLNKKNSLTLKQLFVFYAPKSTSASRQKSEAGPYCFFRNIATLVGVGVFFLGFARWMWVFSFFLLRLFFLSSRVERSVVKDLVYIHTTS